MSNPKINLPLVAIAVPVYNTDKYLRECLEHILNQTYQNWVCYISDCASTDTSYTIALEFEARDIRFKAFRDETKVSAFRDWNVTLGRMADLPAKYIKYECADDWMFPECIEKMVDLLETDENIGLVYGYRLQNNTVDCDGLDIYSGNVFDGKDILKRNILNGLYIKGGLGQAIYRMEALKKIDSRLHVINENNIHCDVELDDKVLLDWKIGFVYQVLTYYRIHEDQINHFTREVNTNLFGNERRVFLHLALFPELKEIYQEIRLEYALFLLKCKRKNENEIIAWHTKNLERPITKEEYSLAKKMMRKKLIREIRMNFIKIFTV
jgi:glycosyltransferase involved in cell wall biosynthesis